MEDFMSKKYVEIAIVTLVVIFAVNKIDFLKSIIY